MGVLTFMIYSSGGMGSNLMTVLVMAVAANAILLPFYSGLGLAILALLLAVFASLIAPEMATRPPLLTIDYFPDWILVRFGFPNSHEWSRLGMFGLVLLTVAYTTHTLAERARRSEELARRRAQELLEIAELNEAIVQHLQSGIIVIRADGSIRLLNSTARELLNCRDRPPTHLDALCPALAHRLQRWWNGEGELTQPFRAPNSETEIIPQFSYLGVMGQADVLIFLEDAEHIAQRIQQIKLAALGRLTASIAHELRNPLAAISHAAQLLQETNPSPRLPHIIHDNAQRANAIISDVLTVSRRDKAQREVILLAPFLTNFLDELVKTHSPPPKITLTVPKTTAICFDPGHFRQILWNLCQNACMHGQQDGVVQFNITVRPDRSRVLIDIEDFGPGIPSKIQRKLFEPFFTTQSQGTGLGLYISRELCESNRARLTFLVPDHPGSCFRLTAQAARFTEALV